MHALLVGDIGGTKTTLGLYTFSKQGFNCINQKKYLSCYFDQFNDLLQEFINESCKQKPDALALSVAGPVIDDECETTNLPWRISAKEIKHRFGIGRVRLLNDIEATGAGLVHSSTDDFEQINPQATFRKGHRAVISIGTGLGEAFLFWDGRQHNPVGTEGGHIDFAPVESADIGLWHYLKTIWPSHISSERVISGPGIVTIYDYLCQLNNSPNKAPQKNIAAWISSSAMQESNHLCCQTMEIFTRLLASEASNLVLKTNALGGIYIAGGIAPKIIHLLHTAEFLEHFLNKGRFRTLLSCVPIWINKSEATPLIGALWAARALLGNTSTVQPLELPTGKIC